MIAALHYCATLRYSSYPEDILWLDELMAMMVLFWLFRFIRQDAYGLPC